MKLTGESVDEPVGDLVSELVGELAGVLMHELTKGAATAPVLTPDRGTSMVEARMWCACITILLCGRVF